MKMKKMLATVMATALAVTLVPTAAFASSSTPEWNNDAGEQTLEGEGSVIQPILEVALPGDLAFEVDPGQANSLVQILGADYNIVNRSNVKVAVSVKPYIDKASGSKLKVVSTNGIAKFDPNAQNATKSYQTVSKNAVGAAADEKYVAIDAIAADTTTNEIKSHDDVYLFSYKGNANSYGRPVFEYSTEGDRDNSKVKYDYSYNGTDGIISLTDSKESANELLFLLDKFDPEKEEEFFGDGTIKQNHTGIATSFTLVGTLDSHSSYADGEIKVKATYKMDVVGVSEEGGYTPVSEKQRLYKKASN